MNPSLFNLKTNIFSGKKVYFLFALSLFFISSNILFAANLYFSPSSGTKTAGSSFTANVYVSSTDQSANAVSGTITFPTDKLSVSSISKSGSIVSLWVEEPSFSNQTGTIKFEGIMLNPGYTGSGGKIIGVNFVAKQGASGSANLAFSQGSVLANDGAGTNILNSRGTANFVIGPGAPLPEPEDEVIGESGGPEITSPTHPDSDKWYNVNVPVFEWDVPSGVDTVALLYGRRSNSTPSVLYSPAIDTKTLEALDDGVWYFHARFRTSSGYGPTTHFKFQIDTALPDFEIEQEPREDKTEPTVTFNLSSSDELSGMDKYEFVINGDEPIELDSDEDEFTTPILAPGEYELLAYAVDNAGNKREVKKEFSIEALEAPIITEYTEEVGKRETIKISGETKYKNGTIIIETDGEEFTTEADSLGNFTARIDGLTEGKYNFTAKVVDTRGAMSNPSNEVTITIKGGNILELGENAVKYLTVFVPLLALLIIIFFMIWIAIRKYNLMRKAFKVQMYQSGAIFYSIFRLIKKDADENIKLLEKAAETRPLTKEEKKILGRLKENLLESHDFTQKRLKELKKK